MQVTAADGAALKKAAAASAFVQLKGSVTQRAGADSAGRPAMYAPNPLQSGSSVSHWDVSLFRNQLMEPYLSSDLKLGLASPVDLTYHLLKDLGW